ncbi:MAG: hypothetical protein HZA60_00475 [Deltaproteobacteria bacterium]|nr:hypothetical protein [Deltaproteobacteria bacterium]
MNKKTIEVLQILSISLIWVLFTGIAVWIVNLIKVSLELHDAPDASVGISIVAIPVFLILASVLTYVFLGLRKGRKEDTETEKSLKPDQP